MIKLLDGVRLLAFLIVASLLGNLANYVLNL